MKRIPGFVPINYSIAGKVFFTLGIVCILLRIVDYFSGYIPISKDIWILGFALLLIGAYFIFVVSKE